MTGMELRSARKQLGWTQQAGAARLGVTQPYLSMLERGVRPVPKRVAKKLVSAWKLSPLALPTQEGRFPKMNDDELARALGALGYEGFRHLPAPRTRLNPADLLLSALAKPALESRLAEAMPWLAWRFAALDWERVMNRAKMFDLQNRLGFVVTLGKQLADQNGDTQVAELLRSVEERLRNSILARADALGRLTKAERDWLERERSSEARQWNVLSDMRVEHLTHAR